MIYLDNSATTMPDPAVLETFSKASVRFFANPSSLHDAGMEAERFLQKARHQLASFIEAAPEEIIFTSGGTESNNIAIKGVAWQYGSRGRHIVTTAIEHPSVIESCRQLEETGFRVTYIKPGADGIVRASDVIEAIEADTILVSMMHVNNETGAVQPVQKVGTYLKNRPQIVFHVDAVQSFGKMPVQPVQWGADLLSVSGHKINGLKGTGFLWKRSGVRLTPLLSGGGQEDGFRSGTENTAGAAALAKAARLSYERDMTPVRNVMMYMKQSFQALNGAVVHTPDESAPHILSVSFPAFKSEVIVHALEEKGLIVSTTSACSSKKAEPSRVLQAMGVSKEAASSAIRISLSHHNTMKEADLLLEAIQTVLPQLAKKRTGTV